MAIESAENTSEAITRVREVAEFVRSANERIAELEAGLRTIRESTRRDLQLAQARVDEAEARAAADSARAEAAERRCQEVEARLTEIVTVIAQELPALDSAPRTTVAEVRQLNRPAESSSGPFAELRSIVDQPDRPRAVGDSRPG
jgi:hypothetical protein